MLVTDQERLKSEILKMAEACGHRRSGLLPMLQDIQRKYHCVSEFSMQLIADALDIHPVEVHSVVSFYKFLSTKPQGRFVFRLCGTISCDLAGKDRVARQLQNELGIGFRETTPDGKFTLDWTNCLGMCDQGPALMVNEQLFTRVTPEKVHEIVALCRASSGPSTSQSAHEEVHA